MSALQMDEQFQDLEPPKPYASLKEIDDLFPKLFPPVVNYMSWISGRHSVRLTKKDKLRVGRKVHDFLVVARPYLLGLGALRGQLDRAQSTYALLEGLLREQYRAGGRRIPDDKDAFAYHLDVTARMTIPNPHFANSRTYAPIREALVAFAAQLVNHVRWPELDNHLTAWTRSSDGAKYAQFIGHWKTLSTQFQRDCPKRITTRQVMSLAREYAASASFFEQRMRLLIYLSRCVEGRPLSWPDMEKQTLKALLDYMESHSTLRVIGGIVDRHVRNALAHGLPEIVPNKSQVRFYDREVTVTWGLVDFFEKTRQLTIGVLALAEFEAHALLQQTRQMVEVLWRSVKNN
jgi:hypothetical protein